MGLIGFQGDKPITAVIVPPAPISHPNILPCPSPNNINRTPSQLDITNIPNMSLCNPHPNTPRTLPPPSFIEFDMNNPPTQVQSISPILSSEKTCLSLEEFSLNHHGIKKILNNALSEAEKNPVSIEIKDYLKKGLTFISQKEHELSSSQAIGLIDGNVEVIERDVPSICSSQSSLLEEVVPDGNHKKKSKIQNKPPPNIRCFMQQSVTINNTQQVVSMIPPTNTPFFPIVSSPPQCSNPQLLLQAHPNDLPSHDTPCHSPTLMVFHQYSLRKNKLIKRTYPIQKAHVTTLLNKVTTATF
ncbi:hypothetical protein O181_084873, partial [Austropuccinia psidii MF-1]|nr:hypothetical protein [Austropuccinia psidii MF-1]